VAPTLELGWHPSSIAIASFGNPLYRLRSFYTAVKGEEVIDSRSLLIGILRYLIRVKLFSVLDSRFHIAHASLTRIHDPSTKSAQM
jgi:hypothetical protein